MSWSSQWNNTQPARTLSEANQRYQQYTIYIQEQNKQRQAEEFELLRQAQSNTNCYTSESCATGFVCTGGRCMPNTDPVGSTGSGSYAGGCGMGPSSGFTDIGQDNGGGQGCNSNSSGTGGSSGGFSPFSSCATSGAGVCGVHDSSFASGPGANSGNSGGGDCGTRCCSCTTAGCLCNAGECPPRNKSCSYFCDQGKDIGLSLCDADETCGECEDCISSECQKTYHDTCTCDSPCSACEECGISGDCLQKVCPAIPAPPKDPDSNSPNQGNCISGIHYIQGSRTYWGDSQNITNAAAWMSGQCFNCGTTCCISGECEDPVLAAWVEQDDGGYAFAVGCCGLYPATGGICYGDGCGRSCYPEAGVIIPCGAPAPNSLPTSPPLDTSSDTDAPREGPLAPVDLPVRENV